MTPLVALYGFWGGCMKGLTGFGQTIVVLVLWSLGNTIGLQAGELREVLVCDAFAMMLNAFPLMLLSNACEEGKIGLVVPLAIFMNAASPIGTQLIAHIHRRMLMMILAFMFLLVSAVQNLMPMLVSYIKEQRKKNMEQETSKLSKPNKNVAAIKTQYSQVQIGVGDNERSVSIVNENDNEGKVRLRRSSEVIRAFERRSPFAIAMSKFDKFVGTAYYSPLCSDESQRDQSRDFKNNIILLDNSPRCFSADGHRSCKNGERQKSCDIQTNSENNIILLDNSSRRFSVDGRLSYENGNRQQFCDNQNNISFLDQNLRRFSADGRKSCENGKRQQSCDIQHNINLLGNSSRRLSADGRRSYDDRKPLQFSISRFGSIGGSQFSQLSLDTSFEEHIISIKDRSQKCKKCSDGNNEPEQRHVSDDNPFKKLFIDANGELLTDSTRPSAKLLTDSARPSDNHQCNPCEQCKKQSRAQDEKQVQLKIEQLCNEVGAKAVTEKIVLPSKDDGSKIQGQPPSTIVALAQGLSNIFYTLQNTLSHIFRIIWYLICRNVYYEHDSKDKAVEVSFTFEKQLEPKSTCFGLQEQSLQIRTTRGWVKGSKWIVFFGIFAGMTGSMLGIPGPPLMIMTQVLGIQKNEIRATQAALGLLNPRSLYYLAFGLFRREDLGIYLMYSLAVSAGQIFGSIANARVSQVWFMRVLNFLVVTSAMVLFLQAFGILPVKN